MHPWHDVDLGDGLPNNVPVVIEVSRGARAKYAVDRKSGLLRLKQTLITVAHYPMNYGFVPRTLSTDGDALDVLVLSQECVPPLTIVDVRPIGGIEIRSDKKGKEAKLIAVEFDDPEYRQIKSIKDLPEHRMRELEQFFDVYKAIEKKNVEVQNVFNRSKAIKILEESIDRYQQDPVAA